MITAYRLKTAKVNQKKLNEKEWPAKYSCRFWEPGVVSYEDVGAGVALLQKETMDKMIPSFIGKPVIIDHDDLNPGNFKEHAVGYISDVKYNEKDGWYYADFILTDDEAKRKVQNGYSVSCGFDATNTGPGGEWHAVKYNEEITDGVFEHMALVTNPRYEGSKIYVNSKKDNSDASNKTYDALLKEIQSIQVMTEEKCRAMVAKIDSSNLSASEKDNLEHNLGKQRARSHSKDNANPVLERLIEIARGLIAEGMPMDKVLKQFKPDDAKRIEAVLTKENAQEQYPLSDAQKAVLQWMAEGNIGAIPHEGKWLFPTHIRQDDALAKKILQEIQSGKRANAKPLDGVPAGSYKGFELYRTKDGMYAKKGGEVVAFDTSESLLKMTLDGMGEKPNAKHGQVIKGPINGMSLIYSEVNAGYLLMWHDQVVSIITDKNEALAEFERCTRENGKENAPLLAVGDRVSVPDGYEPDGNQRPWKPGRVISISGGYCQIKMSDGTEVTAPCQGVKKNAKGSSQDKVTDAMLYWLDGQNPHQKSEAEIVAAFKQQFPGVGSPASEMIVGEYLGNSKENSKFTVGNRVKYQGKLGTVVRLSGNVVVIDYDKGGSAHVTEDNENLVKARDMEPFEGSKENAASFMCPQCGADVSGEQETEAGIICPKCHTDFWKSEALTPKAIAEGKRPLRGGKQNSSGIIKAKKVSNATGEKPMFGFFKKKRKNEAPVTDEDKKKKEAEILADKSKKDMENAGEPVAAPAAPAEQDLNELLIPIDGQMVPVAELIKVFKAEQLEKAEYEELSLEDEVTEKEAGNKFKMNDLINCYKAKAKKNASDEKWFHRPKKEKGGYGKEIVEFDTNKVIDETGVYPSEAEAYQEAERIISSLKREKKNSEEETPEAKAEREKKENEDKAKAEAEAAEKAKKEKENSETPEQKAEREKKEKENAEETPEEKAAKEAASAEEKELQIQKDNAKKNPRDLKYFMRINGLKDAGEAITDFALETVHDKIERGNHRYGSKKSQQ